MIYIFVKGHESLDIVLESSTSYNSDAYDQFGSTVLFRMVKKWQPNLQAEKSEI